MLYVCSSQRVERRRRTVGQLLLNDKITPRDTSTAGLGVAKDSWVGSGGVREGVVMMRVSHSVAGPRSRTCAAPRANDMGVRRRLAFSQNKRKRGEPNMAPPYVRRIRGQVKGTPAGTLRRGRASPILRLRLRSVALAHALTGRTGPSGSFHSQQVPAAQSSHFFFFLASVPAAIRNRVLRRA
ncbi:hypothetical protein BJV74DRAFT_288934 [Russula compacta]|nr:hypothetical protein BJV74DRAFT_288934 [Russula compacta]